MNSKKVEAFGWKPFEVDISEFVKKGSNSVLLRLKNTLRNLLGSHHRPLLERQQNWGYHDYIGDYSELTKLNYPEWWKNRSKDTDAWTENYMFVRFGIYGSAVISA